MVNHRTSRAVDRAVGVAVHESVYMLVHGPIHVDRDNWAVWRGVDFALHGAVYEAVYWAVDRTMNQAVVGAVEGAVDRGVDEDSEHPAFQDFLIPCGTGAAD